MVGGVAARDRGAGAARACVGGAEWRGRSLGAAAVGRWQRARGGADWRTAAEGSERSADPRGGAQRGAAPVPAGLASGGVERGRAGSDSTTLIVGGDGQLAKRLGLDQVDSVAAVVARLEEGAGATGADCVRPSGGAGREPGTFWPPRTLTPNVR